MNFIGTETTKSMKANFCGGWVKVRHSLGGNC